MKIVSYFATDIGLVRNINQDGILVDLENGIFIVADGMGGHQGGEVASALAIKTMSQELQNKKQSKKLFKEDIHKACLKTNKVIYDEGQKDIDLRGMGTTLCGILVNKDLQSYIFNIGDSRLYMQRDNKMWLLTEDHNFITEYRKNNFISKDNTLISSVKDNILTKSMGYMPTIEPDITEKSLKVGDKYLICSDGLCGFVPDEEIHTILKTTPLQDVPKKCIKKALDTGGEDNISVIVIEVQ